MMVRKSLHFEGPRQVGIQEEEMPALKSGEVLVRAISSAISPGTERLIYRDLAPKGFSADATISALEGDFDYPFKYGYSMVGEIIQLEADVDAQMLGKRVFAFNPHESYFTANIDDLQPVPDSIATDDAVFLPNMETAVNFVMDGKPLIGERVVVFGQGIVGLLTTSLLAEFPLEELVTIDNYEVRRNASLAAGAERSLHSQDLAHLNELWSEPGIKGADLLYELSGSPEALNAAIRLAGFGSRIVIGSWYGEKKTPLELGREFHRNRIHLLSSQVSTLAPEFQSRWDKNRRFEVAWKKIPALEPSRFITHRFSLEQAAEAYRLLDQHPEEAIQIIFDYT